MSVDLKTITPDNTLPQDGVLFGADSQAAANPSVYPVANVKDALNSGIGALSGDVNTLWDVAANPVASVTLSKNTTLYVSNFKAGGTYKLIVFQDATGGWTLGYDGNFKWPNDTAPTVSSTAYAMTVVEFVSNGTYLYGSVAQPFDGSPSPTVMGSFTTPAFDFTTLTTTTTMPTGGSISRAGNAMLYDSTGKLTYAPNNLLTYSEQFNNAAWSKTALNTSGTPSWVDVATAPDGTTTAEKLIATATTGEHYVEQSKTPVVSNWAMSVYVKVGDAAYTYAIIKPVHVGVSGDTSQIILNLSTLTWDTSGANIITNYGYQALANGWYRIWAVLPVSSSVSSLRARFSISNVNAAVYTGDASSGSYIWGAQLEQVTYQTTPSTYVATTSAAYYGPRFDYDPSTLAAKGLLIEGTRTNICPYSQDITNASGWAAFGAGTATLISSANPSGVTSTYQIDMPAANTGWHANNVSVTSGTTYSLSIWIKADAAGTLRLFDGNGILTGADATINVTTSWQRFTVTGVASSTNNCQLGVYRNSAGQLSKVYIWGAQIEVGAFSTSYVPVPTTGSTARAAETFSITGYSSNLIEAYYTDEATGIASSLPYNAGTAPSTSYGWTTSLRAYTNAYVGDITTPSWIDNSGTTGNRMVTDSSGMLTWAPANALINSQDLSVTANWTYYIATDGGLSPVVMPDGTQTGRILNITAGTSNGLYQTLTSPVGVNFIFSVWLATASGTQTVRLGYLNGTTRSANITVTTTPTRYVFAFTTTATTWNVSIENGSGAGAASVVVWHPQVEAVTYQTSPRAYIPTTSAAVYQPRYDYDPSTVPATPRGLLIEESRSNLLTYSNTFTGTGWTNNANVTVAATSATNSPDGTLNAVIATATAGASAASVTHSVTTVTASTAYSYSIYVKGNVGTTINLNISDWVTGQLSATINPFTGVCSVAAGVYSSASVASENVGNGWWRYKITATQPTGQTGLAVRVQFPNNGDSCYLFGAQLEQAAFATSYMGNTTTGSPPITRAADIVKLTGSALTTLSGTVGSLMLEFNNSKSGVADTNPKFISSAILYKNAGGNAINTYNGSTVVSTVGIINYAITNRTGLSWGSGRSIVVNGGTVAAGAGTLATIGASDGYVGNDNGSLSIDGYIRSLALYNQRLPDAILKQKSSVGAAY